MLDMEKCESLNMLIAVLVVVVLLIIGLMVHQKRSAEGWMTGGAVVSVQKMDESYFH